MWNRRICVLLCATALPHSRAVAQASSAFAARSGNSIGCVEVL